RVPWETLIITDKFPALEAGLAHRYEAEQLAIAKWLEERQLKSTLELLLVVNPTGDLRGAEAEGDRIKAIFGKIKPAVSMRVQRGASFAEAFLRGGVANYIGTYWPVGDDAALQFAETFYPLLLAGKPLGSALLAGRNKVREKASADWADYIFYGDPAFALKLP